ncbi:amidohydrolase family protein [Polaromonas sp. YR568]|uniref:amidohydrolase family protein n=1 Tax=Polaromonas sp. YR568 TaxID=1855301 RepID=UPI00398BF971
MTPTDNDTSTAVAAASQQGPVIDTHAHVFTTSMPLAAGAWHKPAADADAGQYIDILDKHGITFGVLAAASISGTNNDQTLEACRQHRRLRTTVILSPDCPLQEMKEMAARGVVGVRFQWRNMPAPDLTSGGYRRLIRNIADLGWHVQLHDDGFRLPAYLPALEAAGVKVVVDHFGRPDEAHDGIRGEGFQRLLRSIEGGRTWVKLSSPFRLLSESLVREAGKALLENAGPERLMWGSDWPFAAFESSFSYDKALANLNELVPDAATRRRISCDTPLKFYFA